MNLQMKYDCVQIVHVTCSKMYIKVSDFQETCQQTAKKLCTKIEKCESDLSSTKEKWYS